jgi:hypothetical protein
MTITKHQPVLNIVTMPPTMHAGTYRVSRITPNEAALRLRQAAQNGSLQSHVNFASTCQALRGLTGIPIELVSKIFIPPPNDGDCFLSVRLRQGTGKHQTIGLADLDFFWIEYSNNEMD